MDGYSCVMENIKKWLRKEDDLLYQDDMPTVLWHLVPEILVIAKMVPDEISTVADAKDELLSALGELKKSTGHEEMKGMIEQLEARINGSYIWNSSDWEFVVKNTYDDTIH